MKSYSRDQRTEVGGQGTDAVRHSAFGICHSPFPFPISNFQSLAPRSSLLAPRALTLIELLVVIVILMTLIGGVIPLLSPNNDARKISQASRSLQTYVNMAKAKAARTGRPVGIAFSESSAGSGVALEVFQIEVPPPFAGFSNASAARIQRTHNTANGQITFEIQFLLSDTLDPAATKAKEEYFTDSLPPQFLKFGDIVMVGDVACRLVNNDKLEGEDDNGFIILPDVQEPEDLSLPFELVNSNRTLPFLEDKKTSSFGIEVDLTAVMPYRIMRQPKPPSTTDRVPTGNAESPLQLPAGIGIDLMASGLEGNPNLSNFTDQNVGANVRQISILFSPQGGVDSVIQNGKKYETASHVMLLLGRVENAVPNAVTYTTTGRDQWKIDSNKTTKDQFASLQDERNWLSPDSRWLTIAARSGRVVVSDNGFVSFTAMRKLPRNVDLQMSVFEIDDQLDVARQYAREMKRRGS